MRMQGGTSLSEAKGVGCGFATPFTSFWDVPPNVCQALTDEMEYIENSTKVLGYAFPWPNLQRQRN
ncbi:hypothetical protein Pan54_00330 [Rubinisphaera italica]|uniref:Uncharacterized protein n=1 Tax=Rubinisphaera italica TaxID=2527969 RepID=A0A5C5XBN3_9PLAN|nr:hypothetical protein Pan54_00330 [Rubinisphaera italica]